MGRPHGLDGSFHVLEPRPGLLAPGTTVRMGGTETAVERRAGTDAHPIVRLSGCAGRDAAAGLRGTPLLVRAAESPELGEDEWHPEQLEGCDVVDGDRPVGTVTQVIALPSCEALEVERPGAPALLVPLVSDAVRRVDVEAKVIDVDLAFVEG